MSAIRTFQLIPQDSPLLISVPHAGRLIPEQLLADLNSNGRSQPDADHFVDRLYSWASDEGMSLIVATHSRYVVDLNRPANDEPLYPGAGTGLAPIQTFAGERIYRAKREPTTRDVESRVNEYWHPYHRALGQEIERLCSRHGHVVLLDAHSIASVVPRLFKGKLPDLNLGSNSGASADPGLLEVASDELQRSNLKYVVDGRFKGGYITRHYGQPAHGVHALQLELAQDTYMDEEDMSWDPGKAQSLQSWLLRFTRRLRDWVPPGD